MKYYDGRRVIRYEFADGAVCEVETEVSEAVAELLADFERKDKNYARNLRRRGEISLDGLKAETGWEPIDPNADVETQVLQRETLSELYKAKSQLNEKQRKIIRLFYYEEKTFSEIAKNLGVNRRSVSKQLDTILKKLKNIL